MSIGTALMNVLLGVDMGLDGLDPGSIPDLTISAHTGMAALDGKLAGRILMPIVNAIMFDRKHCYQALLNDLTRAQVAEQLCQRYAARAAAAIAKG